MTMTLEPDAKNESKAVRALFVVHAQADEWFVRGVLVPALGLPGEDLLLSSALRPGAPLLAAVEQGISTSMTTVVVVSRAFLIEDGGRWARHIELLANHAAVEDKGDVVPLLLEDVVAPLRLRARVSLDLRDRARWGTELARLREVVVGRPGEAELVADPWIACPYPGMRSLKIGEAVKLFGRERELDEIAGRFAAGERMIFLVGPSGCGKSSLVEAGVLPRLTRDLPGLAPLGIRRLRPGELPAERLDAVISEPPDGGHPEATSLLVVDQLEEVFALVGSERRAHFFVRLLALREDARWRLLCCLRADFFAELISSSLWSADAPYHLVVSPLRGEALRQAIVRPALDVGVHVEPGLVERLISDASGASCALPLLQETMVHLWAQRTRRLLSLSDYERLGEGHGAVECGANRSGLAVAISRRADACLRELSPRRQQLARRVFLRLASFGDTSVDTRWQRSRAALSLGGTSSVDGDPDPELDEVLHHLTSSRLLTVGADPRSGEPLFDLSHESLLKAWDRLAGWVRDVRADGQRRRQLEQVAASWATRGRGKGGLLEADELDVAEAWRRTPNARLLGESAELTALIEQSAQSLRLVRRRARVRAALVGSLVGMTALFVWLAVTLGAARTTPASQEPSLGAPQLEPSAVGAIEHEPVALVDPSDQRCFAAWPALDGELGPPYRIRPAQPRRDTLSLDASQQDLLK
jgi:energy-coupling factor transporter ATP-binding protein EcfA2